MLVDRTPRAEGLPPDVRTLSRSTASALDASIGPVDWATIPDGIDRWSIDAPSGRLAGLAAGSPLAPRIILVPGITGSKEDFVLMIPLLVEAGYRVETFDLAGHYHSIEAGPERLEPPQRRYDHALFVEDLLAVIGSGSAPVHLLGYSFGGTLAQLAAARHPERIASLTLLSCPPVPGQTFRATKSVLGPLSRVIGGRQGAGLMLWGIRRNFNRTPAHRYDFVMHRMPLIRRSCVDDVIRLMRRTPDLSAVLARLHVPKLVAFGGHDLWPAEAHEAFARRIGATAVEYEAGHSPCEETPHQLCRDMVRMIEGLDRDGDQIEE